MGKIEIENFRQTIAQLKLFMSTPIVDDRDRAGIIQAFEFSFEQSWKAIQKLGVPSGGQIGNPKQAFTFAIQSGWIHRKDEADWLKLLEDRNLTSHTYQQAIANEVLARIQGKYLSMFELLYTVLENLPAG